MCIRDSFLAVLELIKCRRLHAFQEAAFGEIHLEARSPDAAEEVLPLDSVSYTHLDVYKRQHLTCSPDIRVRPDAAQLHRQCYVLQNGECGK